MDRSSPQQYGDGEDDEDEDEDEDGGDDSWRSPFSSRRPLDSRAVHQVLTALLLVLPHQHRVVRAAQLLVHHHRLGPLLRSLERVLRQEERRRCGTWPLAATLPSFAVPLPLKAAGRPPLPTQPRWRTRCRLGTRTLAASTSFEKRRHGAHGVLAFNSSVLKCKNSPLLVPAQRLHPFIAQA